MKTKIIIRNNIESALKIHNEFMKKNDKYFDCKKRSILTGHLRTYAVEKQLFNCSFMLDAPFYAYFEEVNSFHYPVLNMETADFIINTARTQKHNKIPNASKYRLEHAINNNELSGQITLPFCEDSKSNQKKYAIIVYGTGKGNKITHLGIMLPDSQLKSFYEYDNLLELPQKVEGIHINQIMKEEEMVKLRDDLENEMSKIV